MNRSERRRKQQDPRLISVSFTPDELDLLEEALDAYQVSIRESLPDSGPTVGQAWALQRSEVMRAAMRASLEKRLYFDSKPRYFDTFVEEFRTDVRAEGSSGLLEQHPNGR